MRNFPKGFLYPTPKYRARPGGERLKKKREISVTSACLDYLRLLENTKQIAHYDRINSGSIKAGKYFIRLCRKGTADIYIRLNNGHTAWVENKLVPGEMPSPEQLDFRRKVIAIGDTYVIITSVREMQLFMEELLERQACVH